MLHGNNLGATGEPQRLENGFGIKGTMNELTSAITNPTTKLTDAWAAYQTVWAPLKNCINNFINTSMRGSLF